jgi:hypothetical protein
LPISTETHAVVPKRTHFFLMRGFQLRYALLVAGSLIVLLTFASLHGLFVARTELPAELSNKIWGSLRVSTWRLVWVGLLYTAVVTIAAVFLSHRFTGPAVRLAADIRAMAEDPTTLRPLAIRDGDDLDGIVQAINELIEKIKEKQP